jgi:hypothetical protein
LLRESGPLSACRRRQDTEKGRGCVPWLLTEQRSKQRTPRLVAILLACTELISSPGYELSLLRSFFLASVQESRCGLPLRPKPLATEVTFLSYRSARDTILPIADSPVCSCSCFCCSRSCTGTCEATAAMNTMGEVVKVVAGNSLQSYCVPSFQVQLSAKCHAIIGDAKKRGRQDGGS